MTEPTWAPRPRPAPGSDASRLGRWQPATPADLTAHRRELVAALHNGARPPAADEEAVEDLLLVFEELVSNALRHGWPPVAVEVTTCDGSWLLDVSDAAVDRPPAPAVDRDAAHGGLGLYLVARLCTAYGWTVAADRKHVWARIDHTDAEAPASVPRPRNGTDGHG
jgi:anti-sigma regulatory factor (Ser/Thr protein kinase)